MILYHGSTVIVKEPQILLSQRYLDFGMGFYTTSSEEQAKRWALKVGARRKSREQYISIYDFDFEAAKKALQLIEFSKADESWLDFVCTCRSGKNVNMDYDMVMGPVADDNVYATVQLYELGVLDKEEVVKRLKVEALYNQILFHTEESLAFCRYQKAYQIGGGENGQQ